ncbi:unnamed protein product [Clonostachys chloroleuca]|uniref:C2H2-type domain-containing protein n=1 Tax=Clonostachys chloroleuca TaxID=1926264 RepID=A0AA35LS70_9HYPO|nr:unnamed protein product [Clonostachys chloroleuca]
MTLMLTKPRKSGTGIRNAAVQYTNRALEASYQGQADKPTHGMNLYTSPGMKRKVADRSDSQTLKPTRAKGIVDESNVPADDSDSSAQTWACPFFRHDPLANMDCVKLKLTRIRDVKQHIQRRHNKFDTYCSRCRESFSSLREKEEHLNLEICRELDHSISFDRGGISQEAQNKLKYRALRSKSGHEQWFDVYDIVFEGQEGPDRSGIEPQLGTFIMETTRLMQSFWENENSWFPEYCSRQPQAQIGSQEGLQVLVNNLMGEIHRRFEERIQGSNSQKEVDSNSSSALDPPSGLLLPATELIPGNHLQHEIADFDQTILDNIDYVDREFEIDFL